MRELYQRFKNSSSPLAEYMDFVSELTRELETVAEIGHTVSALSVALASSVKCGFTLYCPDSEDAFQLGSTAVRSRPMFFANQSNDYRLIAPTELLVVNQGFNYIDTLNLLDCVASKITKTILFVNTTDTDRRIGDCDLKRTCGMTLAIREFISRNSWHISRVCYGGAGMTAIQRS